ncbi:hypothetical protein W02_31310 [Nitrospira sp. KM1]|uniref:hypothetical protein n=1 Tax=Nitrospira sp. KM1 TaxID=1936990 RepID=UPI0013A748AE|nr:hypothetical protein [Nitrospira sp. KM1]BCA55991.1 hypothetical protein W02_31310 [Nitrospira sp. KM1]
MNWTGKAEKVSLIQSGKVLHSEELLMTRRVSAIKGKTRQSQPRLVVLSAVITWAVVGPMQATVSQSFDTRQDSIVQVEASLERAAINKHKVSTQRDVHDITFLLEQSWKSAVKADLAARKLYAKEALTLLQRSAAHGDFDLGKADPVLILIRRLLSDQAI